MKLANSLFLLFFLIQFATNSAICAAAGSGKNWMSKLDDQTLISAVTLPGTHESGALKEPLQGTARTQSATIDEQLNFGIRLFDIRCRHLDDSFHIYHGIVNQDLSFSEVLQQVYDFLDEHPTEFVVMSIAQTNKAKNNTRSFTETLDSYLKKDPQRWHLGTDVPKLKTVRGKIVLLRRFHRKKPQGLDATQWPDNTTFSKNGLVVQDRYRVQKLDDKWKHITDGFKSARKRKSQKTIHLNFTSGYVSGNFGIPNILNVSNDINNRLARHFEKDSKVFHGWIMMDFATEELAQMIYRCNLNDE